MDRVHTASPLRGPSPSLLSRLVLVLYRIFIIIIIIIITKKKMIIINHIIIIIIIIKTSA